MNIKNINKLLATYFIENGRHDFFQNLVVFFLVSLLIMLINPANDAVELIVFVCWIIGYASRIFGTLSSQSKSIHYMMVPANGAEKVITKILLVNVYFVLSMAVALWLAYSIAFIVETFGLHNDVMGAYMSRYTFQNVGFDILALFASISVFFFCSVYFRKKALIKTVLWLILVFFVLFGVVFGVSWLNMKCLLPAGTHDIYWPNSNIDNDTVNTLGIVCSFVTIVYFYGLSFLRLRETEV